MSVQVSTRIDEATKQQFDKVCEHIGTTPSNALSMFIKSVINNNGIPFVAVAPKASDTMVSGDSSAHTAVRPPFGYESMKGKIWMADDFNDSPVFEGWSADYVSKMKGMWKSPDPTFTEQPEIPFTDRGDIFK